MNYGTTTIQSSDGKVFQFTATGPLRKVILPSQNPGFSQSKKDWRSGKTAQTLSARFFVGCNVGQDRTWTADDVSQQYIKLRTEAQQSPDVSIVTGQGVFSGVDGVVEEHSIQLIVNEFGVGDADIQAVGENFLNIAYNLSLRMLQESVGIEITRNGVIQFADLIQSGFETRGKKGAPALVFNSEKFSEDVPQFWGPDSLKPADWPDIIYPPEVAAIVAWTKGAL